MAMAHNCYMDNMHNSINIVNVRIYCIYKLLCYTYKSCLNSSRIIIA